MIKIFNFLHRQLDKQNKILKFFRHNDREHKRAGFELDLINTNNYIIISVDKLLYIVRRYLNERWNSSRI